MDLRVEKNTIQAGAATMLMRVERRGEERREEERRGEERRGKERKGKERRGKSKNIHNNSALYQYKFQYKLMYS